MLFRTILPFFSIFLLIGCTKSDPNAYKYDPIFQDYQQQLTSTTSQAESLKKEIETVEKDIKTSAPQTGQVNSLKKKLYAMRGRLQSFEQQIRFWKIRIESRAIQAQKEYLEALANNKEWPDKAKIEAHYAEKRLRQAKMVWDHKERIEEYKKNIQKSNKGNQKPDH